MDSASVWTAPSGWRVPARRLQDLRAGLDASRRWRCQAALRLSANPGENTFAHLDAAIGWEHCKREHAGLELVRTLESKPLATLAAMMRKGINSPQSSSCGRLFDAVAAAVGLCQDAVSYEGEAAIALESIADARALALEDGYPIPILMHPLDLNGLTTMDLLRCGWPS